MTKRKVIASILTTGVVLTPAFAFAFLPSGIPVYDAASDLNQTIEIVKMIAEVAELTAMYTKLADQLTQMQTNARFLTTLNNYRQIVTPWQGMWTTNTYGNVGAWIAAVNNGFGGRAAWNLASLPRVPYGAILRNIPLRASCSHSVVLRHARAAGRNGKRGDANFGRDSLAWRSKRLTLATLENDSLSPSASLNTELAVLNKINAAGMVNAREASDANKLLGQRKRSPAAGPKGESRCSGGCNRAGRGIPGECRNRNDVPARWLQCRDAGL